MRMGDDSNDDDDDDYDGDDDDDSDDDDGEANGEGLAGSQRCRQAVCSLLLTNPIAGRCTSIRRSPFTLHHQCTTSA